MRLNALLAALSVVTVFVALDGQSAHAQTQNDTTKPATKVIVKPGDNLSKIGAAHGTTYVRLYNANTQIAHPDIIHPGQNLRVPAADEVLASRPLPAAPKPAAPAAKPAPAKPAAKPQKKRSSAPPEQRTVRRTAPPVPAASSTGSGVWDRLARCESGGNWSINTGNGYYGGLQFSLSSWNAVGGNGLPSQASKSEQIARAEMLKARQGWGAWPACSAKLGLR